MNAGIQTPKRMVIVIQAVVAALASGVVAVGGVAAFIGREAHADPAQTSVLLLVVCALALGGTLAYFLVRRSIVRGLETTLAGDHDDPNALPRTMRGMMNVTVIGAALAEGVGLFGAIVTLITGSWLGLLAAGLALLALLAQFPTQTRCENFASQVLGHAVRFDPER